jgi:hypothetical protein
MGTFENSLKTEVAGSWVSVARGSVAIILIEFLVD